MNYLFLILVLLLAGPNAFAEEIKAEQCAEIEVINRYFCDVFADSVITDPVLKTCVDLLKDGYECGPGLKLKFTKKIK